MAEKKDQTKKDLLFIALGVSWEYAMGLISNRYAGQIPLLYFSMLLALPLILTLVWIIRMERQEGRIRALLAKHPVSTVLVVLLCLFVGWSTFTIYAAKLRASTETTSKSMSGSNTTPVDSAGKGEKSLPTSPSTPAGAQPKTTANSNEHSGHHNQQQSTQAGASSLVQNNSGGVNIQQGTTGNNSPITNSPINVGDVTKRISKEQIRNVGVLLSHCANKPKVDILGDQYSARGPFLDQLHALFTDAGFVMLEPRPNMRMIIGASAKELAQVSITEYGEPVAPGSVVQINSSDPAFCVLGALKALGLEPTVSRSKNNPMSFAPFSETDEVYVSIYGNALDGN